MKKVLFWTSLICSSLLCIFMWTKLSLNGYKTDLYFFLGTLLLNLVCFRTLYKADNKKSLSYFSFSFASLQVIGLCIFLCIDTLQVDKVYEPYQVKYNLYSSFRGWYKKAYYKQHQTELCNDGKLWETKVPYYFPVIEIETSSTECHKVDTSSEYVELYKHIPE